MIFISRRSAEVMYGESSMRNGFGLRLLHKFFGLPFLRLQRETLTALMERNQRDTDVCTFELTEFLVRKLVRLPYRNSPIHLKLFILQQSSKESDYNDFLENLVHKRRQLADANPKNTTHFSGNSMGSSNLSPTNGSIATTSGDFRPTKSIVIGAGQPIIVPGQRNITNEIVAPVRSSSVVVKSDAASEASTNTNGIAKDLSRLTINSVSSGCSGTVDHKVISVEEFCPDGETLDKSFLEDVPNSASAMRSMDSLDSDSDSNETGNPLVAKYHEEPGEDDLLPIPSTVTSSDAQIPTTTTLPTKVNPLARGKHKSSGGNTQVILSMETRRTSLSSDEIEMPVVMKTKQSTVGDSSSSSNGLSNEEFDSWLSDSNQRRSPDGIEDITSLPSNDKTIAFCANAVKDDNSRNSPDEGSSTSMKVKKHKSSKKKSKRDKDEKVKKKSRRSKQQTELEDFLTGAKTDPIDDAYEAL